GEPASIPICRIGFQHDVVRTCSLCREACHQLVGARAPRACKLDDSPPFLPPPQFSIELATADMHLTEFHQDCPVRFGKEKPHPVRVDNLQSRSRFEVQEYPFHIRLTQPGILFKIELDDLGIEDLPIMKFHPAAELYFKGCVIEP